MQYRENLLLRIRKKLRDASDPFNIPENVFRSLLQVNTMFKFLKVTLS